MGSPAISSQKLLAASQGNPDLLEVLRSIQGVSTLQQAVTGTTPTAAPVAGQPSPAAPVPPQATGTASLLGTSYVVQIVNPGATSPISQLQNQQQTANATPLTPLQPVKAIFHQIRASTSPAFNVNSNTQLFGGNTGSPQVYWTLTGLGSGTWFFQFRSSYDGINFNTWKNVNGGTALGGLVNEVTVESPGGGAEWALFTLPGGLTMGVGAAELADGAQFNLATQLYSSAMFALAGPNGFSGQGNAISGFALSDVDLVPSTLPPVGIPDLPVVMRMQMAIAQTTSVFPAYGTIFAIAFDPSNPNVTVYPVAGGSWAVFILPGGGRIAIGQGKTVDGSAIPTPAAVTWINGARVLSVCSLTDATLNLNPITGINQAQLSGLTAEGSYLDTAGNPVTGQEVNWLAIAYQAGVDVSTIGSMTFLQIPLQGGHAVVFGAGQVASGTPITLPAGFTSANGIRICTPGSCANTGHHLRGVQTCAMFGLTPELTYTDNTNVYSGNVNIMGMWWK
jgi:hypothetical protein